MFKKILNTFGTKIVAAALNFLIAIIISQTLGDTGSGTQSLVVATIAFSLIFSEIVCGASIIYLAPRHSFKKILVTGGGARNKFLMERLQARTKHEVVIPEKEIIDYKEALIFAFLGLRRLEGKTNVLASVTGAESNSCSGKIWKND